MSDAPYKPVRIEALFEKVINQEADQSDYDELSQLLDQDPEAQSHYLSLMHLNASMAWEVSTQVTYKAYQQLKFENEGALLPLTRKHAQPEDELARHKPFPKWIQYSMAAMLLFSMSAAILMQLPEKASLPSMATLDDPSEKSKQGTKGGEAEKILMTQTPLATLFDQVGAVWGTRHPIKGRLFAGEYHLLDGLIRFKMQLGDKPLSGMKWLTISSPAHFKLDEDQLELSQGMLVLKSQHGKQERLRLVTPGGTFIERGTEVGVDVQGHTTRATVFRGGVYAELTDRYVGMVQKKELTRDDQVFVTAAGEATFSINDDDIHFAVIRPRLAPEVTLANHSFEYPRMPSRDALTHPLKAFNHAPLAAAGWAMVSHPIDNSEGRIQEGGLVRGSDFLRTDDESQWVMLRAHREEGKVTHNSIHQKVGRVKQRVTYEVSLNVGRPLMGDPSVDCRFAVALYATDKDSPKIPTYLLHQWVDPVRPIRGQCQIVTLKYKAPRHFSFRGQDLYLVIEALPGKKTGFSAVLVDDIRLKVLP